MEYHLKFVVGKQRQFIENVIQKSGLNTDQLAMISDISPRNFRDWKREKICIPKSVAILLSKNFQITFPEKLEILEKRWRLIKSNVGKSGGIAYKIKYGNPGTTEGRKRGGRKSLSLLRSKGIIPPIVKYKEPRKSIKLAEFVGIMLGDGNLGKLQISIALNSIKDSRYINYVSNLCFDLFKIKPHIRKRKNANCVEITLNGESLISLLINIGLVKGNKVKNQVEVPNWIKSNTNFKRWCLRGLMDTDGGIFIHKYNVNGKVYSYKKVCFTNSSTPLLYYVYDTLIEFGFSPKVKDKVVNKKVWLYNSHEVEKYLEIIGSSNIRLNRFKMEESHSWPSA